jgi:hypothetical protein
MLAAVMDGIEKEVPEELTQRPLTHELVIGENLDRSLLGPIVKPCDSIIQSSLSAYIRPMGGQFPSIYGPSGDDPG